MKIKSHINFKRFIIILLAIILSYLIFNAYGIYNYSKEYSEEKCDVAIVLGAGTSNGKISPIFKERIKKAETKSIFISGKSSNVSFEEITKKYKDTN